MTLSPFFLLVIISVIPAWLKPGPRIILGFPVDNPSFFLPLNKGRDRVGLISAGMTNYYNGTK